MLLLGPSRLVRVTHAKGVAAGLALRMRLFLIICAAAMDMVVIHHGHHG